MPYHVKEQFLVLPDMELDCISFGKGDKPLVMIQGLNTRGIKGAGLSLAWMYRIFAKDYKVCLFDRRKDLRTGVTIRDLANDLAAAMDHLGITKACVFGVSQGGMIAQELAIQRPDLVRKMVLAVTASRTNSTIEQVIHGWMAMTEAQDWKALVRDMAEKLYSPAYLRRYRPFLPLLTLVQKPKDIPRFLTLARACLTCDTHDRLSEIRCPVLVLGGKQDRVVGGEASQELADALGCAFYMYETLGHAAYEEAKDFNQRVYDFFTKEEPYA
ncbi:MAG: alpha/beta fold hydrolase [Ruminiclostridium sp.]|nr:alpha/beta fold hydrolase [Ruminiclostridium sp.]